MHRIYGNQKYMGDKQLLFQTTVQYVRFHQAACGCLKKKTISAARTAYTFSSYKIDLSYECS